MPSDASVPAGFDPHVLESLAAREPVRAREGRNLSKATLAFYRIEGRGVALKTFARHPYPLRATLGRWSIAREARAYAAAGGAPGLPAFYGVVGGWSLAVEWLDASPLSELSEVAPETFDKLESIVAELHRRGVALGDVHHGDVLIAANGDVHLVDLATAVVLGDRPGAIRRALFNKLSELDRIAMARLRARFMGDDPEAVTDAVGGPMAAWHRRGRRVKALWDRMRGKRRRAAKRLIDDNRPAERKNDE